LNKTSKAKWPEIPLMPLQRSTLTRLLNSGRRKNTLTYSSPGTIPTDPWATARPQRWCA